jgi:hypothetical protein
VCIRQIVPPHEVDLDTSSLGVVADMTLDHDHLHAVGRLSSALAVRLLECWPKLRPLPAHDTRPWY